VVALQLQEHFKMEDTDHTDAAAIVQGYCRSLSSSVCVIGGGDSSAVQSIRSKAWTIVSSSPKSVSMTVLVGISSTVITTVK
jgi:hypothetical protein